ncbi:cytosolic long-chain acyl-CoA thioester hydrolase [Listeria rocourtiae FSL F6-920]|nr:cytosolic long-chain acyl-CoA thioester hydrolase [Listeria rocourtiae FSL F6-920]
MTFVAIDDNGKTVEVPTVQPQSEEEKMISRDAEERSLARKRRLKQSRELAASLSTEIPWG